MTANVVRQRDGHTVVDVDDGCEPGNHRRDALCAYLPLPMLEPAVKILSYHYGPTATDPDPGTAWCDSCGDRAWFGDGHGVCGCGAQVCESPDDCGDDNCEFRERGGMT